jgi:hypothetical protein
MRELHATKEARIEDRCGEIDGQFDEKLNRMRLSQDGVSVILLSISIALVCVFVCVCFDIDD